MKICIVTPAPPRSRYGNRITALHWSRLLRQLGHDVVVRQSYRRARCDLLLALHAARSHESIERFHAAHPELPLLVALTGTDLYHDVAARAPAAMESLRMATQLIAQHRPPSGLLPVAARRKLRVIHQAATPPPRRLQPLPDRFEVCVIGHLRPVKDPFRVAAAIARLPGDSRIAVTHLGAAMSAEMRRTALQYERTQRRYRWLGDVPHAQSLRIMSRCRLMVISSLMEGGPHVMTEALVTGLPVLATAIPAIVGRLGRSYPGLFPIGSTPALRELLLRAECDERFYESLVGHCQQAAESARPIHEVAAWRRLIKGLSS